MPVRFHNPVEPARAVAIDKENVMRRQGFARLRIVMPIFGAALLCGWIAAGAPPTPKSNIRQSVSGSALNRPINPGVFILQKAGFPPIDAKATCTATIAPWFESGSVSLNGAVKPADSVTFSPSGNCSFYQWSEQMFLWLTSPAPSKYGGGAHIFDSPSFYDVSPPDAMGKRTFIPHVNGVIRPFNLRVAKVGPHRLPVIFDRAGRMFEIQKAPPNVKPMVRTKAGNLVEVERVAPGANGQRLLLDKAGKQVAALGVPSVKPPVLRTQVRAVLSARKFIVNNIPILLDSAGNVIDVEQGQAGGDGVLEARNGSLVYYATMVNDVYAYFLTGAKNGGITPMPTQFPTTQAELNKITAFASAHGKTFPDPNALAIELKSSWVEVTSLPNASSYITMKATVPTYNMSNPDQWIPTGQKTVTLALVGMHVVGSTKAHAEMIWATFEHFGNAPNGAYSYINSSNVTKMVPQSTAGTWLFTATNSAGPFNAVHMHYNSTPPPPTPIGIIADMPHHISPSDTIRWKAWGGASDSSPNPLDPTTAASNTEVIAVNNSVMGQLANGDIRGNYIMTGATWTTGGAPTGSFPSGNEVGTSKLANTTMETYQQGSDPLFASGANCFTCHGTLQPSILSHVFGGLAPLF
jgi:hypothetical protein